MSARRSGPPLRFCLLLGSLVGIYGAVYERFGMLWALIPALTIFWALSAFWPKGEDS